MLKQSVESVCHRKFSIIGKWRCGLTLNHRTASHNGSKIQRCHWCSDQSNIRHQAASCHPYVCSGAYPHDESGYGLFGGRCGEVGNTNALLGYPRWTRDMDYLHRKLSLVFSNLPSQARLENAFHEANNTIEQIRAARV